MNKPTSFIVLVGPQASGKTYCSNMIYLFLKKVEGTKVINVSLNKHATINVYLTRFIDSICKLRYFKKICKPSGFIIVRNGRLENIYVPPPKLYQIILFLIWPFYFWLYHISFLMLKRDLKKLLTYEYEIIIDDEGNMFKQIADFMYLIYYGNLLRFKYFRRVAIILFTEWLKDFYTDSSLRVFVAKLDPPYDILVKRQLSRGRIESKRYIDFQRRIYRVIAGLAKSIRPSSILVLEMPCNNLIRAIYHLLK